MTFSTSSSMQSAIAKRQELGLKISNLSFADYTFFESPLLLRGVKQGFRKIFRKPYYYLEARGGLASRRAIAQYYQNQDQEIDPESLILTASINQSYLYLFRLFSTNGGQILVPSPGSASYREIASFLGIKLTNYHLSASDGWQINLADLESKITNRTRAIVLMSPHLPSGAVQSADTLRRLAQILQNKNIALIVDESLGDFIFTADPLPLVPVIMKRQQLVISLQSLSSTYALPGGKLAWMQVSGPAPQADKLAKNLECLADTFLSVNQFSQTILPDLVEHAGLWRRRLQRRLAKNQRLLCHLLGKSPRLRFHQPQGGFYLFVEVLDEAGQPLAAHQSDQQFCLSLLKQTGIYVHPGSYYGLPNGCHFMICFMQNPRLLRRACKKILKFLGPVRSGQ